jgi:hypothetical protein
VGINDRQLNFKGEILRNGWYKAQWNQESSLRQGKWDLEWKLVQDFSERRNVTIMTSSTLPETEATRKTYMATFPALLQTQIPRRR